MAATPVRMRTVARGFVTAASKAAAASAPTGAPWRVCIVGSGPAGFYTADTLLKGSADVRVDILDRLPVPFGLVRYGVAPDHPEVKNVTERFSGIAREPRVRFAGNVLVADGAGATLAVDELRLHYDAVVLACGAEGDRHLAIPGEELRGVHSAREFVAWYNGHPDYAHFEWDLSRHHTAVVVGQGNVALDVARVLSKRPSDLAPTDITSQAVATLKRSAIRRVVLAGRRGPLQAAFTTKELRELTQLEGVRLRLLLGAHGGETALSEEAIGRLSAQADRPRRRQMELLRKIWLADGGRDGDAPPSARDFEWGAPDEREIVLAFQLAPSAFLAAGDTEPAGPAAQPAGGAHGGSGGEAWLGAARFERTRLSEDGRRAEASGEAVRVACGYAFRSVGYRASPLPAVPFDTRRSLVPSAHGRVLHSADAGARPVPGLYCAGWFKRGPSGVILTNIADGAETAAAILADRATGAIGGGAGGLDAEGSGSLRALLAQRGICPVDFGGWEKVERYEREEGERKGKRLEKVTDAHEMLRLARGEAGTGGGG